MSQFLIAAGASRIVRLGAISSMVLLSACGTFQLAGGIYPPPGKTQDAMQTDVLVCKDQAKLEANSAERQAGAFALGLTIVGVPVAFELEKSKQREVFARCMTGRGYRITPVDEKSAASSSSSGGTQHQTQLVSPPPPPPPPLRLPPAPAAAVAVLPAQAPVPAIARDDASQLEKLKSLRDRGLITEDEYKQKRQAVLDRL